jgi:hypothetical protein
MHTEIWQGSMLGSGHLVDGQKEWRITMRWILGKGFMRMGSG